MIALLPTALSFALYLSTILLFSGITLAARWRKRRAKPDDYPNVLLATRAFVSILKPLAGNDDELEANLESFAHLDDAGIAGIEILFGVAKANDPAAAVARGFLRRHPRLHAKLFVTDPDAATNPKVAQLIALEREARGNVLVVSDSNVRLRPEAIRQMAASLAAADLVTNVFAGTGERTLGAALENLQLGSVVMPGVAVSVLGSAPLTIGKSMAMRRDALAAIGGFAGVGDVLAEDHVLGRKFRDAGLRVKLSMDAVENRNVGCTFRRTFERHTRWSKLRRTLVPGLFFVEPLLQPLLVATLTALVHPTKLTVGAWLATAIAQTLVALLAVRIARGHVLPWKYAPLEIVRTFVIFTCWLRACASLRIEWRGHPFRLTRGSRICRIDCVVESGMRGKHRVKSEPCETESASSSSSLRSRRRRVSVA